MTSSYRSSNEVELFHAHVYYTAESRASIVRLHERMKSFTPAATVHTLADGSRGPHVRGMFGIDIPKPMLAEILSFLVLNRGPHAVLLHPVTQNELLDHTQHALWLGPPQPLDLSILASS